MTAHPERWYRISEGQLRDFFRTDVNQYALVDRIRTNPIPDNCTNDDCIYKRFSGNWKNAEMHDAETRIEMAKTLSQIIQSECVCSLPEILYIIECVSNGNKEPFKNKERAT